VRDLRRNVRIILDREHEAAPAGLADLGTGETVAQARDGVRAEPSRALAESLLLDDIDSGERHGRGERVTSVRGAVRARLEHAHHGVVGADTAHGVESAREGLTEHEEVGASVLAASLLAEKEAQKRGFTQVLWLDAAERKYIEEVGSMNILFKIAGKVITPPLGGTILAGVTRDSVLQLLKSWNVPVEERRISIDEVMGAHAAGTLEEVFGAGTAAVISPVGMLDYKGRSISVSDGKTGPLALKLYDEVTGIQYGRRPDPFHWLHQVPLTQAAATPLRARAVG